MKMKITPLFVLFAFLSMFSQSQNLSLSNDYETFTPDQTIYIWGDSSQYSTIICYLHVTNNSASDIDVLVKKTEISILAGSENSFCWGMCYPPAVFESPDFITISAGQTDLASFSGDYLSKGQIGTSTIRYTFFDKSNSNDSASVIVVYGSSPASINDFASSGSLSVYPNPTTSVANFSYQSSSSLGNAQLVVISATGAEVYRSEISSDGSPVAIDLSSFNSGIYFYSVIENGQSSGMRKFVVTR